MKSINAHKFNYRPFKQVMTLSVVGILAACDGGVLTTGTADQPVATQTSSTSTPVAATADNLTLSDIPSPDPNRATKLMPLGDSITRGIDSCSYRSPLARLLQNNSVEFVGKQGVDARHPAGCTETNFEHAGRAGWRAIDWLKTNSVGETIVYGVTRAELPDIVLLHIGSNDINRGELPGEFDLATSKGTDTVGRINEMINQIYAASPHTAIYVADLIPWPQDTTIDNYLNLLRIEINKMVSSRTDNGDRIKLVKLYEGFQPDMMQTDSVHPNTSGDVYMANKWLEALHADGYFLTTGNTSKVRVEAEHGTLTGNMKVGFDGTGYVATYYSTGYQADYVTLDFAVQDTGIYRVLGKVKGTSEQADSLFFQMNSGDIVHWSTPVTGKYVPDYVSGSKRLYVYLKAGSHSATIYSRRQDTRLDWLEFQFLGTSPNGDVDGDGVPNSIDSQPNDQDNS